MFTIREAVKEDAPVIHQLIRDLAEYEKEPESAKATVEDILRDGFGPKPLFECLMAEVDGEAAGFAIFYFKWSTWTGSSCLHLEDLFVKPVHRGKKIGYSLLKRLAQIAVARNCDRFEWDVLDWNMLARDFYHSLGAKAKDGWLAYRMDGQTLRDFGAPD